MVHRPDEPRRTRTPTPPRRRTSSTTRGAARPTRAARTRRSSRPSSRTRARPGIEVVVSAGNAGSSLRDRGGSAGDLRRRPSPIGATDSSDNIAGFSSRGPVTIDGSGRMKPDVSAPGVDVRSSVPGGGYANFSGTSMAGPARRSGSTALLLSAYPELIGDPDAIEPAPDLVRGPAHERRDLRRRSRQRDSQQHLWLGTRRRPRGDHASRARTSRSPRPTLRTRRSWAFP